MQFIDLLTYPEIDPKASKKASFAGHPIAVVKQASAVTGRKLLPDPIVHPPLVEA